VQLVDAVEFIQLGILCKFAFQDANVFPSAKMRIYRYSRTPWASLATGRCERTKPLGHAAVFLPHRFDFAALIFELTLQVADPRAKRPNVPPRDSSARAPSDSAAYQE
jgi:hypothetical protein